MSRTITPASRSRTARGGDRLETTARSGWWLLGVALVVAALLATIVSAARGSDTGRGIFVIPVILLAASPIIYKARRLTSDFDLGGIMFAAVGAKLVATYGRFQMVDELYSGVGDSTTYHVYGERFAPQFRSFDFAVDPELPIPGTGFIRVLTGLVYALVGSDRYSGFLVFGFMGLVGTWFFYRAFSLAVPDGQHRRYAILVMFWPSLIFWPSAIGKEAWMLLSLGVASYGAAALYHRMGRGLPILTLGILGALLPRPHIAIVVLVAIATGLVMGSLFRSDDPARSLGFVSKAATAIFLLVLGSLVAPRVATFLNIDDVGGSGFTQTLDEVVRRTSQGGSNFTPAEISTPLDYPWAAVTVLLRPFPHEANNLQSAASAAEGMILLLLLLASLRELAGIPRSLVKNPYAAYAFGFAFMFVYVFAFIGNFGILTRQRSQLLPFVFVLLSLAPRLRRRGRGEPDIDLVESGHPPGRSRRRTVPSDKREAELVLDKSGARWGDAPAISPPRVRQ